MRRFICLHGWLAETLRRSHGPKLVPTLLWSLLEYSPTRTRLLPIWRLLLILFLDQFYSIIIWSVYVFVLFCVWNSVRSAILVYSFSFVYLYALSFYLMGKYSTWLIYLYICLQMWQLSIATISKVSICKVLCIYLYAFNCGSFQLLEFWKCQYASVIEWPGLVFHDSSQSCCSNYLFYILPSFHCS